MRLFAYGTLQFPDLMGQVCGRQHRSEPATLSGYAAYLLRGRSYPGIVPRPGSSTQGRLYHGLDRHAISRLDRFEGREYRRVRLPVATAHGHRLAAWAYLPRRVGALSERPWDAGAFARDALAAWLGQGGGG